MTRSALLSKARLIVATGMLAGATLVDISAVSAQDCASLYRSIRAEARYCGFFCDETTLQPLQAAYEGRCIAVAPPPAIPTALIEERAACGPSAQIFERLRRIDVPERLGKRAPRS
jgi:hypothetical protein